MTGPFLDRDIAARRYPHGTRARHQLGGCRCFACRVANTNYETERQAQRRPPWRIHCVGGGRYWIVRRQETGEIALKTTDRAEAFTKRAELVAEYPSEWSGELVSTQEVRQHVRRLARAGLGSRTVSKASGVSRTVIRAIVQGEIRRTRRSTAERILAVVVSDADGSQLIEGGPTWKLLDRMLSVGYTRTHLARLLGSTARVPALQVRRDRVRARTARRVREVYEERWKREGRLRVLDPPSDPWLELNTATTRRVLQRAGASA